MEGVNNLRLDDQMLVSLYGRTIIDLKGLPSQPTGSHKTIIFFRDRSHSKLPDKQYKFLDQILRACKINIVDVDIVNLADGETDFEGAISKSSPAYILSFGSGTGTELFSMKNNLGTKYLNAPDLSELMQETAASKQLKGKLWTELKEMFNL